jgi:hypothetical protein
MQASAGARNFQQHAESFGWRDLQVILSPGGDYDRKGSAAGMLENLNEADLDGLELNNDHL